MAATNSFTIPASPGGPVWSAMKDALSSHALRRIAAHSRRPLFVRSPSRRRACTTAVLRLSGKWSTNMTAEASRARRSIRSFVRCICPRPRSKIILAFLTSLAGRIKDGRWSIQGGGDSECETGDRVVAIRVIAAAAAMLFLAVGWTILATTGYFARS